MVALPAGVALAQDAATPPRTAAECRRYAVQQANEDYMAQRRTNRQTSPFAHGPSGRPDPLQQSADQQAAIDRIKREQQLYDDCVARLRKP
jgi:hypothetical protein